MCIRDSLVTDPARVEIAPVTSTAEHDHAIGSLALENIREQRVL